MILVSGPVSISPTEKDVKVVSVESAREMLAECEKVFGDCDMAIMTAAVADYTPAEVFDHKIKREKDGLERIELVKNPDIAATLGKTKKPGQILVGFALETDHETDNATDKLTRKNLDMIVLNSLRDKGAGFRTDTNKVTMIYRDGRRDEYALKSKREVAADIIDALIEL